MHRSQTGPVYGFPPTRQSIRRPPSNVILSISAHLVLRLVFSTSMLTGPGRDNDSSKCGRRTRADGPLEVRKILWASGSVVPVLCDGGSRSESGLFTDQVLNGRHGYQSASRDCRSSPQPHVQPLRACNAVSFVKSHLYNCFVPSRPRSSCARVCRFSLLTTYTLTTLQDTTVTVDCL